MPTCKCLKQNSIENMYLFKQKNQNSEIDFNLTKQKLCEGAIEPIFEISYWNDPSQILFGNCYGKMFAKSMNTCLRLL